MARILTLALFALFVLPASSASAADPKLELEDKSNPVVLIKTNMGDIYLELFAKEAPKTVQNFIGLAEGTKTFTDPKTNEDAKRPYYDGLVFHRVIKNFMIQGGCPLGTGSGGPGYKFEDEINPKSLGLDKLKAVDMSNVRDPRPHPWLLIRSAPAYSRMIELPVFRKLGIRTQAQAKAREAEILEAIKKLTVEDVYVSAGYEYSDTLKSRKPAVGTIAMANSGPNTNGSQFFIALKDNDFLSGKHTVFGKVVSGMDVVRKIGATKTAAGDRPVQDMKIESVRRYKPKS